jgi:hypothetical protein
MTEQATGQYGQIAEVAGNDGDRVLVSLPLVGFPPGFQLLPGDQVVVVHDVNGPAVRPLVRAVVLPSPAELSDRSVTAAGQRYSAQAATQRDDSGSGPQVLFVIERAPSASGEEQVVAIRRDN